MALTKVNIIGDKYYHRFVNPQTGEYYEVETTQEDYEQLGQPNPTNPVTNKEGFEWQFSGKRKKYDTATGDLEDDQYADYQTVFVKVKGKAEVQVEPENIVNGTLDNKIVTVDEKGKKVKESDLAEKIKP